MNYYPFHLGDYAAHTAHLEPMEDLAYRRMLDLYYRTEKPLPREIEQIARLIRMKGHEQAIEQVVDEFFEDCSDGWSHVRCDAEIAKMQDKQAKAKASAAASVKARSTPVQRTLNERSTDAELPTPTPTPEVIDMVKTAPAVVDSCPQQQIIDLYHQTLPTGRQVREWTPARASTLRSRWRESQKRQNLDWWQRFFSYCSTSPFLTGQVTTPGRKPFELSLDWLIKPENMAKVIEGAYHEAEREAA